MGLPGTAPPDRQHRGGPALGAAGSFGQLGLDGSPPQWPETQIVDDPLVADSVVRRQAALGYREIKVYQRLRLAAFDSIVASARRAGLAIVGHVPSDVPVRHALASGMHSIEHLTGYNQAVSRMAGGAGSGLWADVDRTRYPDLISATVAAGVWNCPTLAIQRRLLGGGSTAANAMANLRAFVRDLVAAGGRVVAGSDAGIDVTPAGAGLLEELSELEAAGLTPRQVLLAATRDAGALAFPGERIGVVEVGAVANLLIVPEDPLRDLSSIGRFEGIMVLGSWRTRDALRR